MEKIDTGFARRLAEHCAIRFPQENAELAATPGTIGDVNGDGFWFTDADGVMSFTPGLYGRRLQRGMPVVIYAIGKRKVAIDRYTAPDNQIMLLEGVIPGASSTAFLLTIITLALTLVGSFCFVVKMWGLGSILLVAAALSLGALCAAGLHFIRQERILKRGTAA